MTLAGRRALVTGGGRRIGRALCLALADGGARVAVHYHASAKEAEDVARRVSGVALRADLRRVEECEALVERAWDDLGGLDVLVNNASTYRRATLAEIDEAAWDDCLASNLKGPFFCARAAGLRMRAAGSGAIVNLTDWGIARPHPSYLPYYAAKAGLAAMTAGLARALAPEVRVNAVAPGPVLMPEGATPEQEAAVLQATPLRRLGGAESVVSAALFLIGNEFVTGQTVTVDGGRSLS